MHEHLYSNSIKPQTAPPIDANEMLKPALLVVAPWVYHAKCGIGGGVLCFNLLRELAPAFNLHFLAFDQTPNDLQGGKRALQEFCTSVTTVPVPKPGRLLVDAWQWLWNGVPRQVQMTKSVELAAALTAAVARVGQCVVILQFPEMAQYVRAVPAGTPVVVDTQDVASVSRFREWKNALGMASKARKGLTWLGWARHELKYYPQASALVAISESDLGALQSFAPDARSYLSPVAVAVPTAHRQPIHGQVGFVGNFKHPPNADGLVWLLREVWPRVRAVVPTASLHLAGPSCPTLTSEHIGQGVVSRGFVDDLATFFAECSLTVAPNRFGGGVKIKSLEALAHGCPLVATTIGSEGLHGRSGHQLVIEDTTDRFALAIVDLLQNAERREALGESGRLHVMENFSWKAKTAALSDLLVRLAPTKA